MTPLLGVLMTRCSLPLPTGCDHPCPRSVKEKQKAGLVQQQSAAAAAAAANGGPGGSDDEGEGGGQQREEEEEEQGVEDYERRPRSREQVRCGGLGNWCLQRLRCCCCQPFHWVCGVQCSGRRGYAGGSLAAGGAGAVDSCHFPTSQHHFKPTKHCVTAEHCIISMTWICT